MATSAFLNCSHPVQIQTFKGLRLVRCGKCVQCRDFKRQTLSSALQTECYAHKYQLFITLTYDNNNIPYIDFRTNHELEENSFCTKIVNGLPTFCVAHNLHHGDNSVSYKINYGDLDNVRLWSDLDYTALRPLLDEYNTRRHKYMSRYPDRDFSGECFQDDVIPFVHYPDLQKFMKRLRITIKRKFNYDEEVRFYAIGEYGTNSLRPHWHIILNHDCDTLNDYCRKKENWTYIRTRNDGKELYSLNLIHSLWSFGTEITEVADKNAYTYLASYVNQSACYPKLLQKWFPQRSRHSNYLGEFRSTSRTASLFKEKAFDQLTTIRKVVTKNGISYEQDFSAPLSSYSRFIPKFSGLGTMSTEEIYRTLGSGIKRIKVDTEKSIEQISKDIFITLCNGVREKKNDDIVLNYGLYLQNAIDNHTRSTITTYLYACRRVQKICDEFNISLYEYVHKLYVPFLNYLKYKQLCNLYVDLETNIQLANDYYASFDSEGNQCFNRYCQSPFYLQTLQQSVTNHHANIKHLSVAESYKF